MAGKTEVSAKASAGGIGFTGLLTIAFIVLKLVGVIDWSWIWVLSPLWISFALFIIVLLILFIPVAIINNRR